MRAREMRLPGVLLIEPAVHADARGYFFEAWHAERYAGFGIEPFVQSNVSHSRHGVLRGLHFQEPTPQAKLVSVLRGAVFDVAVDVRAGSPTLGEWLGAELSERNRHQLYLPEGFAHGFVVTSPEALVMYHCSAPYSPAHEHGLRWDDPEVAIDWPVAAPALSPKDERAPLLRELAAAGSLPPYSATHGVA